MRSPPLLPSRFGMGFLLGVLFFGGLWWTIRHRLHSPRAALWMLGSLVLRSVLALTGFWLVAGHDWKRMLPASAGFLIARIAMTWASRVPWGQRDDAPGEIRHAPQP